MSRIGKNPVDIPKGVAVSKSGNTIKVKGPKGELQERLHSNISVEVKENEVIVSRPDDTKMNKSSDVFIDS